MSDNGSKGEGTKQQKQRS